MRQIAALLLCTACAASSAADQHLLPPAAVTGSINAAITAQVLCARGFTTKSVRPPEEYTEALKRYQLKLFGYADQNPKHYEEDHLISLELGGSPSDPHNLWPQPYQGRCNARVKDTLEDRLHELVCRGKMTLAEAQGEIAHNWIRSYNLHIRKLSCGGAAP